MTALAVALGGALGALSRWGLGGWIEGRTGEAFPWGTLVVNLIGAFLLGAMHGAATHLDLSAETRAFLSVGLLGAFTTFSTFSYEAVALLQRGETARAAGYMAASVGVGLVAAVGGLALGRNLTAP